jgi:squalene-hopene/tetraprenyl-beta-curcumene cyclase
MRVAAAAGLDCLSRLGRQDARPWSTPLVDPVRLEHACRVIREALLAERLPAGYWEGELASSALATATAVSAFSMLPGLPAAVRALRTRGIEWLVAHQNPDGGWGDTVRSASNLSTTLLVQAAFHLAEAASAYGDCNDRAAAYVDRAGGPAAIPARYGKDRTFAVPILANCAMAGLASWDQVLPLPFELAVFPHAWFKFLRLHVVSYALPALIAIGQLIHTKRPTRNPAARLVRHCVRSATLDKLQAIQPASGGFLEAVPLTSFVTMSLLAIGHAEHPVVRRGIEFLIGSSRADGSWPIDSNLSIWVTTLSVNALRAGGAGALDGEPAAREFSRTRDWLLAQQGRTVHPYTAAEPGGWGWSHLAGSVPDADDTSGALLALARLGAPADAMPQIVDGLRWLLDLQNRDGGWPTFCRGWGHLPFDRSAPDLTAHALRALAAWRSKLVAESPGSARLQSRIDRATARGLAYLRRTQSSAGSWLPLWFGNEHAPDEANPVLGTARVLAAYRDLGQSGADEACRGLAWLQAAQGADGGWGGAPGTPPSVEETALALDATLDAGHEPTVRSGTAWLIDAVESASWKNPSPIGLYFAKLWYFEKLYPMAFAVSALQRARRRFG